MLGYGGIDVGIEWGLGVRGRGLGEGWGEGSGAKGLGGNCCGELSYLNYL